MLWKKFSSSPLHLRVSLSLLTFLHVIHTSVKGSKKIWKQEKLDYRGLSKLNFMYQETMWLQLSLSYFRPKIYSCKYKSLHNFIIWITKIILTIFVIKPSLSKMKKNKIFVSAFIQNDQRFTVCSFCSFV